MKPKSTKMRFLLTLQALWKFSDEKHRFTNPKMNKYVEPYNLTCTKHSFENTVQVLREFGFDVRTNGFPSHQGFWIEDRILSDDNIRSLIFAVTTNPYITKKRAKDTLLCLLPIVSSFQEPLLKEYIEFVPDNHADDSFYNKHKIICEAIAYKRRIRYSTPYLKCDAVSKRVLKSARPHVTFTPKCIYQAGYKWYVLGYNNVTKKTESVDLDTIDDIKLAFTHNDPKAAETYKITEQIDVQDHIECSDVIYEGPAVFRCHNQHVGLLWDLFGEPKEISKDKARTHTIYSIENTRITVEKLNKIITKRTQGIQIVGPEPLKNSVLAYYNQMCGALLS